MYINTYTSYHIVVYIIMMSCKGHRQYSSLVMTHDRKQTDRLLLLPSARGSDRIQTSKKCWSRNTSILTIIQSTSEPCAPHGAQLLPRELAWDGRGTSLCGSMATASVAVPGLASWDHGSRGLTKPLAAAEHGKGTLYLLDVCPLCRIEFAVDQDPELPANQVPGLVCDRAVPFSLDNCHGRSQSARNFEVEFVACSRDYF